MHLLYFKTPTGPTLGIQTPTGILDVDAICRANDAPVFGLDPVTSDDLAELQQIAAREGNAFRLPADSVELASCVQRPHKIICIGLNYRKHAVESGMAIPTIPVVFTKYDNTLCDYEEDVPLGAVGTEFDYEVELGVVIGERCKNVAKEEALGKVLGYCVANDLSCRDLQFRTSQWLMGKSLDKFSPLGPAIVTADEVGDPQQLQLTCYVNGEKRQDSSTADMVFSVAEIIEDLSKHFTLEPGDLILTGTPEGVALGMPDKPWLKPGDVVRVAIEKLGATENRMV